MSSGGAVIRVATRITPGSRTGLIVSSSDQPIRTSARVVHCHVNSIAEDGTVLYQMAIRFDSELELDVSTEERLINGAPSEPEEARSATNERRAPRPVTRDLEPTGGVLRVDSSAVTVHNDW